MKTDIVYNLYKERGETPLIRLERFRALHSELKDASMTYAGRLDPMAEGVLLVLADVDHAKKLSYTGLEKEYVFEFIMGLETDTYDLLGLVNRKQSASDKDVPPEKIAEFIENHTGNFVQKYPPFSSKVVNGRSLFSLAKIGRLTEKDLPSHEIEIKKSEYLGERVMKVGELEAFIKKTISSVEGEFRQKAILENWQRYFDESPKTEYVIHKAKIRSSSGFYVRQFVWDIGKKFGTPAIVFSILRTKVGTYKIEDAMR